VLNLLPVGALHGRTSSDCMWKGMKRDVKRCGSLIGLAPWREHVVPFLKWILCANDLIQCYIH
jgi:hypothetical protein